MTAIPAATLFTPLERIEQPLLLVEDASIVEVTSRARREAPIGSRGLDFPRGIRAPGFTNLPIHGRAGQESLEHGADSLPPLGRRLSPGRPRTYFPAALPPPPVAPPSDPA